MILLRNKQVFFYYRATCKSDCLLNIYDIYKNMFDVLFQGQNAQLKIFKRKPEPN